jgi:hypothetical protein
MPAATKKLLQVVAWPLETEPGTRIELHRILCLENGSLRMRLHNSDSFVCSLYFCKEFGGIGIDRGIGLPFGIALLRSPWGGFI